MLEARGIKKKYGDLMVLNGIDIKVANKEIISIVGPSGAGKSTLLHILGTLDASDQGGLRLNDTDISGLKGSKLAAFRNKNIGFVFQFHNLLPEFNALENVCIPAFIASRNEHEVKKEATRLLEMLGLKDRLLHKPSQLSGGEQQRVSVARALINKPSIVFADEPSGNLDSKNADELHQVFLRLREEIGQTFVIVTHNKDLSALSDRVLTMKDGVFI